jgi:hypothetical protein
MPGPLWQGAGQLRTPAGYRPLDCSALAPDERSSSGSTNRTTDSLADLTRFLWVASPHGENLSKSLTQGRLEVSGGQAPRVRIFPAPPFRLDCRECWLHSSENRCKSAHRALPQLFALKPDRRKCPAVTYGASFHAFFSEGRCGSPVFSAPPGECDAITNRWCGESNLTLSRLEARNDIGGTCKVRKNAKERLLLQLTTNSLRDRTHLEFLRL